MLYTQQKWDRWRDTLRFTQDDISRVLPPLTAHFVVQSYSFALYSFKISLEFSGFLDYLQNRAADPIFLCILIIRRVNNTKIYLSEGCSWKLNRAIRIFTNHRLIAQLLKFLFCTWLPILQTLPGSISLHPPLSANESRWKMWLRVPAGCSWHSLVKARGVQGFAPAKDLTYTWCTCLAAVWLQRGLCHFNSRISPISRAVQFFTTKSPLSSYSLRATSPQTYKVIACITREITLFIRKQDLISTIYSLVSLNNEQEVSFTF